MNNLNELGLNQSNFQNSFWVNMEFEYKIFTNRYNYNI